MIIACDPIGGLGNQLFQIFTTIAYGIKYKKQFLFLYQEHTRGGTIRPMYWKNLLKKLQIFTTANSRNSMSNQQLINLPKICENGHHYTELKESSLPAVQLSGYFQSHKYFENYLNTILKMIHFSQIREQVLQENSHYFTDKLDTIYISMHFRIGDYKMLQNFHPVISYQYYETALKKMVNQLATPLNDGVECQQKILKVLYFHELQDTMDVKNIIQHLTNAFANIEFIPVGTGIEDWKQMIMMTGCDHHIIANSTFSWWGAYLNPSDSKIVYYPSVWFGPKLNHLRTDDLFPVGWIKN